MLVGEYPTLVVFSLTDNFFTGGLEKDSVFVLSCVAAFDITKGRVGVDDTRVTEILESH